MATVSDLLPSPGAPVTEGTTAIPGPSRPMLPVVGPGCAGSAAASAGCLAAARFAATTAGGALAAGCAPTLDGCATLEATAAWLLWLGNQATKELAALPAMDCAT